LLALRHPQPVTFAMANGDGSVLLSGGNDAAARVWDLAQGGLLHMLAHTEAVTDARFCGRGRIVTASIDHTLRVWHAGSGVLAAVLSGHTDNVTELDCDGDGARAVS